ncbi:hypothetical protein D3C76_1612370 [compost metagenome]
MGGVGGLHPLSEPRCAAEFICHLTLKAALVQGNFVRCPWFDPRGLIAGKPAPTRACNTCRSGLARDEALEIT